MVCTAAVLESKTRQTTFGCSLELGGEPGKGER